MYGAEYYMAFPYVRADDEQVAKKAVDTEGELCKKCKMGIAMH